MLKLKLISATLFFSHLVSACPNGENGEIKFVYSNDVWAMSKKTE